MGPEHRKGCRRQAREPIRVARDDGARESRPGDIAFGDGSEGSSLPIVAPEQERRANRVFVHERKSCLSSFPCNVPEQENRQRQEVGEWLSGAGGGAWGVTAHGDGSPLWGMTIFWN